MTKRASILVLTCLIASSMSLTATAAPAAPKGAPPGYEAQWKAVVAAEQAEEYERALALIGAIPEKVHTVYLRLKKSALLVRLGRFVEAETILSALLKDPAADAIRPTVQGDLDDLRARMPRLTLRLAEGSAKDVWVTVDGEHVGPPVTIPINPGTHVLSATRDGKEVFKQKVTLQDSQTLEVEIDTSVVPPAPPVAQVSVPPTTSVVPIPHKAAPIEPTPAPEARSTWGRSIPAFAAGVVFAGGLIASFLAMSSAKTTTQANCAAQHSFHCDSDAAGGGKIATFQTLGWVSGGLAAASIGVGVVLLSTGSKSDGGVKQGIVATPLVGRDSWSLSLQGSF